MGTNDQSILTTTKRTLGLAEDYTVFDEEIIIHINSVFGTLHQLGVGPTQGFEIEDDEPLWSDFIAENLTLSPIKSYMYLRVKMLFDPNLTGPVLEAIQAQIEQLEWRISVAVEDPILPMDLVLDGGEP